MPPKTPPESVVPVTINIAWTNLSHRSELCLPLLQAVQGWHEVRTRSRFDAARFLADHAPHLIFSSHTEAEPRPRPGRMEPGVQCFHLPDGTYVALTREALFGTRLTLWAPTAASAQSAFKTLRTKYALARKRQTSTPVFYTLKAVGDEVGVQPISLPPQYERLWRRRTRDGRTSTTRTGHLHLG